MQYLIRRDVGAPSPTNRECRGREECDGGIETTAVCAGEDEVLGAYEVIMENNMTVAEAAKIMGVSQQFVRVGLQKGILPFGYAIQISAKKYTYFISRQKFFDAVGISEEERR